MAHQYLRRTYAEASDLVRLAFRSAVSKHLTPAQIEEIGTSELLTDGTVSSGWAQPLVFLADDKDFYELQLYKPVDAKPYIEKFYVRILVPRNRSTDVMHFMWRPSHHQSFGQKRSLTAPLILNIRT